MTLDPARIPTSAVEAFDMSVAAAQHLDERHLGAIVNARKLAWKVDHWQEIAERAIADADEHGGRPRVPQNDNVSPSAFAKACSDLGLTPIGLQKIEGARFPAKNDPKGDTDAEHDQAPAPIVAVGEFRARAERRSSGRVDP